MRRFLFSAAALAVVVISGVDAQTEFDPIALGELEVTGSRLGRGMDEVPVSISVVSHEELMATGRVRLGEVLRELPEFPGDAITDMVAFNETRGVSAADLRGLGAGNTLVLVDGRRTTINASLFNTINTFVDMNRFSPAFVERIEILKGGASAIYGADAVGGVINIITRRQPAGGEFNVSYGNTLVNDAAELSASVTVGATKGKLGVTVGLDSFKRNAQAHSDRFFTRTANLVPRFASAYAYYAQLPPDQLANYDGRSLASFNATFQVAPGQINGQNGVNIPGLSTGAVITALPGTAGLAAVTPSFTAPFLGATGGQFAPAAAAGFVAPEQTRADPAARNLFDYNRLIWTLPEATRLGGMARIDYETDVNMAFFAELSDNRNRSYTQYHPRDFNGVVPRTNAFNPFGVDLLIAWRIPDDGTRRSLTIDDTFSASTGLRSLPGASLNWEICASYSRDDYMDTTHGFYNTTRTLAALASSNPATALDPFGGGTYRQNPTLLHSLLTEAWFGGTADLLTFDAQVSGKLLQLPGGDARGVVYVERRRERFSSVSDQESRNGDILGNGVSGADASFHRDAEAVAAELSVPVFGPARDGRHGPRMAIEAAARIENFPGGFRSGVRPTIGLVAQPVPGLLLRVSEARTFRAPTLPQLYSPQADTYYNSIVDPRRPVALTGDQFDGPNVSRLVRQGGNPNLKAETGSVREIGGVWEVRGVPGLAVEANWFRYDLENIINGVSPNYVLDNELGGLGALVQRVAGSATFTNQTGSPISILTGPAGLYTNLAPGQSATVPGRLSRIDIFTVNLSRRRLVGWDFGVHHTAGAWASSASATYTDKSSYAYDQQSPLVSYAGSSSNPRWRGRTLVDWKHGRWSAGATFNYIASSGDHTVVGYYQKPYRTVHLRASYTTPHDSWLRGTKISVGLDDLFNETPPLYADAPIGFNYSTIVRPQGRFVRVSLNQTW